MKKAATTAKTRKVPKKITETYLHNAGLYYLQKFAASKAHFIDVLMRKVKKSCHHHRDQDSDACAILVHKIADSFEKSGLLNDALFAHGAIQSMRRRGLSKALILNKLSQKGIEQNVSREIIENIDSQYTQNAELEAAITLTRRKKIGSYYCSDKPEEVKKSLAILARAGFSYDTAIKALRVKDEYS